MTLKALRYLPFSLLAFGAGTLAQEDPTAPMDGHWDFLDQYCLGCHNFEDWAGGLALDGMGPDSLFTDGAQWEEVLIKLEAGMMPPAGHDRPEDDELFSFVHALESSLDQVVAANPNPGSKMLHRLNRTEYAYAIEDLLGLKVNPSDLLPRDESSHGFDNAASVLRISPSFLEQYVLAAREVSVMALGKGDAAATGRVYSGAPEASQNRHVDGLPLGTRGGMLIEHFFPADGEYEFSIAGLVGAGYVWGVLDQNTLIITIDDEKIFEADLGGPEDLRAVDQLQSQGVEAINERFNNIRHFVEAGHRKVGVTFLARSSASINEVLHGFVPVDGMATLVQGVSDGPRISNVTIRGPFNPQGVSGQMASRERIFSCYPQDVSEQDACATEIFSRLARQAFRRPVSGRDLDNAMEFYRQGVEAGGFEEGIQKGLMMILASPNFLYRAHTPPAEMAHGDVFEINDLDLASRLSFFLWSRQPDEELLQVAEAGRLSDPQEMENQVRRMLADPRAEALVRNFAFQWLHVSGLDQVEPDRTLYPDFTYDLVPYFKEELALFIGELFQNDAPVTELLSARHSYLNERLALHYGANNVRGGQFQRVEMEDPQRWGLLGKGAVLMGTSYSNRTSPVLRGAWVLEKLVGAPAPAPPPDVEAFPEIEEGEAHVTVRERLEMHRDNPACTSCHAVIDPLGLALENYNAVGQWRERDADAGVTIDASGNLTDGRPVSSPRDLSEALLSDPARFAKTFTEKLMTFAMGRGVEYYDMPTVRRIVREAEKDDYRLSALVLGIVNSPAFRQETYISVTESDAGRSLALDAH